MDIKAPKDTESFMINIFKEISYQCRRTALGIAAVSLAAVSNAYAAPEAPTGLTGSVAGDTVSLSWNADPSGEAAGYNVYANNAYLDTVFGQSYSGPANQNTLTSYTVVAFSSEPLEFSPASDSVELPDDLIPTDLTVPPSVPANLQGAISGSSVSLTWDASTDDEAVQGYNVYQNEAYLTTVLEPGYNQLAGIE